VRSTEDDKPNVHSDTRHRCLDVHERPTVAHLERVFKLPEAMKNVTTPPSWFASQGRRSRNDEPAVSGRFDGRAMASDSSSAPQAGQAWSAADLSTADSQCDSVRHLKGRRRSNRDLTVKRLGVAQTFRKTWQAILISGKGRCHAS
jgi:hypothetical protein